MPPKTAGKKKKKAVDPNIPLAADLIKKFKKGYNAAIKEAGITPLKGFVKALDELAEDEKLLDRVVLNTDGMGTVGFQCIHAGLKCFNFIKELVLWNVGMGDEGMQAVVDFMKDNILLESVEIIDNVTSVGCGILSKYFTNPGKAPALTNFSMDYNGIGDEGIILLTTGIKYFPFLKKLSFNYCHVGATGGIGAFMNVLGPQAKPKLEEFSIQGNVIGSQGLATLGQILAGNTTLVKLNLAENGIGAEEEPMEIFCAGLQTNKHLKDLNLDLNALGERNISMLVQLVGGARSDILNLKVTNLIAPPLNQEMCRILETNVTDMIAREQALKPKKKKKKAKKKKGRR